MRTLRASVVGFDGAASSAQAARLDLLFLNKTFRGLYLLLDDTHGIIGRDILNLLSLRFDGPALSWSESPEA